MHFLSYYAYLFSWLETPTDMIKGDVLEFDGMSKENADDDDAEEEEAEADVDGDDSELILK